MAVNGLAKLEPSIGALQKEKEKKQQPRSIRCGSRREQEQEQPKGRVIDRVRVGAPRSRSN